MGDRINNISGGVNNNKYINMNKNQHINMRKVRMYLNTYYSINCKLQNNNTLHEIRELNKDLESIEKALIDSIIEQHEMFKNTK